MNSIINHILIPMPHMQDPYFNRSVVFMCEHNKDGAMGLIVNKPFSDPTLKELFDSFYDDADKILKSVEQVYFGGPVMVERGIVLHSSHYQSEDSIKISNDFFCPVIKKHWRICRNKMVMQSADFYSVMRVGHRDNWNGKLKMAIGWCKKQLQILSLICRKNKCGEWRFDRLV